jgi:hypothetical protein
VNILSILSGNFKTHIKIPEEFSFPVPENIDKFYPNF